MALYQALTDVLYHYCCPEVVEMFKQLTTNQAKKKWLDALQTVIDRALNQEVTLSVSTRRRIQNDSQFQYQRTTDPLLVKTLKLLKCKVLFDLSPLKMFLATWGKTQPRQLSLMTHYMGVAQIASLKQNDKGMLTHTNSTVTKGGGAKKCDISKLKETCIRDLQLFEVAKGKFIRGKLITSPMLSVGAYTYMEDRHGDYCKLGLYNMIPNFCKDKQQLAAMKFPLGNSVIICEPFYKIFADGALGIRVDTPDEISVIQEEQNLSFESIKEKGRNMVKSGDLIGALELYFCGLTQFKEAELLLSNRSQSELRLELHEEALLDAAAVLFLDHGNAKARSRYETAKHSIDPSDDNLGPWEKLLSKTFPPSQEEIVGNCTRELGNMAFKQGNYLKAKQIYSGALKEFENMAVLLNNIAIVSLKAEMYHTAISAANACLRLTSNDDHRKKAYFSMTKSFVMLGQLELAKLSAGDDPILQRCYTDVKDEKEVLNKISFKIACLISSGNFTFEETRKSLLHGEIPNDFIIRNSLEHFYSRGGSSHGIRAKRHLSQGEVILVDHAIMCTEKNIEDKKVTLFTVDSKKREITSGTSHADFINMLLNRLRHDGLLAKKLLLLEVDTEHDSKKTHVDLIEMGYRTLSRDIPPFLPQTPAEVGVKDVTFGQEFVKNIIAKHTFNWRGASGMDGERDNARSGIALRCSLLRQHHNANCIAIPVNGSLVVLAMNDVKDGDELIILWGHH